jgi:hypothetical protein
MDITALVMTAATKYQVYATGAQTYLGPLGVNFTAVTFPDAEQAETFVAACMGDGIPARYYGLVDHEHSVVVMH